MDIKKVLEGSSNPTLTFIGNNWGLAISIKSKFRYNCSDDDLLGHCIFAFENAERTYSESRNKKNGKKYEFVHHWAQNLKSIITLEKRKQLKEVSLEDIMETNPAIIQDRLKKIPYLEKASIILQITKNLKKAEEICTLYRHGYSISDISSKTKIPIETVTKVVICLQANKE